MKKAMITVLLVLVAASFAACGCQMNSEGTSTPTNSTTASTAPIVPDIMPTMDTNIPDPSVDTEMPIYTEDSNATNGTDMTGNTDMTQK